MDYVKAFLVGGLICALVQILLDRTKLMPGRVMVLLVCSGAVLGFLNIYQPIVSLQKREQVFRCSDLEICYGKESKRQSERMV